MGKTWGWFKNLSSLGKIGVIIGLIIVIGIIGSALSPPAEQPTVKKEAKVAEEPEKKKELVETATKRPFANKVRIVKHEGQLLPDGSYQITGEVFNSSKKRIQIVRVLADFFDEKGEVVTGGIQDVITPLKPDSKEKFSITIKDKELAKDISFYRLGLALDDKQAQEFLLRKDWQQEILEREVK